jgi:hypothetical protein
MQRCDLRRGLNMEIEKGTPVLWYDTIGQIPIRIGLPVVLTAPEAKVALEEFVGFLAELAAVPNADKITVGEAYKMASDLLRAKTL